MPTHRSPTTRTHHSLALTLAGGQRRFFDADAPTEEQDGLFEPQTEWRAQQMRDGTAVP